MSRARRLVLGTGVLAGAGALAVPAVMMTAIVATDTGGSRPAVGDLGVSACALSGSTAGVADLDSEQVANARTIIAVGKSMRIPPRGWVIAVATALQESGLRSLDHGDRDSLGLMQQRPSMGWGSARQVRDPAYAARAFFGGPGSPTGNSGLLSVRGWQQKPLWEAAQTVQRSAYPMAYAEQEPLSTEIVRRLAGTTAGCQNLASGPWRPPVAAGYTLTSGYGWRTSPTVGGADFHTGQDFARPLGSPVAAVSRGVVVFAGWSGSYGNLVRVRHADGVESWYAHLSRVRVRAGARVEVGERVGDVGSTGNSTGPHLHLEIRVDDQPTDPVPWLTRRGVRL